MKSTAILLAAFLLLSITAIHANAASDNDSKPHDTDTDKGTKPKPFKAPSPPDTGEHSDIVKKIKNQRNDNNNDNNNLDMINGLFTGGNSGNNNNNNNHHHDTNLGTTTTPSTLDENTTALFNSTGIAICNGVVPGPCFDESSRTIIP